MGSGEPAKGKAAEIRQQNEPIGRIEKKRRITERLLQAEMDLERCLSQVALGLVGVPLHDIDERIDDALKQVARGSGFDRSYIFLFSGDSGRMEIAYRWCPDRKRQKRAEFRPLSVEEMPWLVSRISCLEPVVVSRIEEIPAEAVEEMARYRSRDIVGFIAVPLLREGSLAGFMRFDSLRQGLVKPGDLLSFLEKAGGVIMKALEYKALEMELLKSRKYETIESLVEGFAHFFNNLLNTIAGNVYLLRGLLPADERILRHLDEAGEVSYKAKELLNQLIALTSPSQVLRIRLDIRRLIENAASLAVRGQEVSIDFRIAPDLWEVLANEEQIRQVIHHIALNAAEASEKGGSIRILADNIPKEQGTFLGAPAGDYVRVTVEDSGPGIPGEDLPRIFDPYFTKKDPAGGQVRGLGLATCYAILRNHNGFISVRSIPGEGTAMHLYFPAHRGETPAGRRVGVAARKKRSVLLMDDEEIDRTVIGAMLNRLSYEVHFAVSGEEAVDLYERALREGRPFDLVILDLFVSKGMGGKETMERLFAIDPKVKAIVSSGYPDDDALVRHEDFGFRGALPKPYTLEDLGKAVAVALLGRQ